MGLASSLKSRVAKIGKSVVQGHRASTDAYVAHLKNIGVKMGDDVVIFSPGRTNIDEQNPHLLSFGSHVAMTGPVTILTHDYSVGVTKVWTHGEILGSQKPVSIGSNVFLGWGCTVLPGTTIGDNCIVGAGSVVSGNVEGGSVWGGGSWETHLLPGGILRTSKVEAARGGVCHLSPLQGALLRHASHRGLP